MQTKTQRNYLVGSLSKYILHKQYNKMNNSFTKGGIWSFDNRIKEFWPYTKQSIFLLNAFLCEEEEVLSPPSFQTFLTRNIMV